MATAAALALPVVGQESAGFSLWFQSLQTQVLDGAWVITSQDSVSDSKTH